MILNYCFSQNRIKEHLIFFLFSSSIFVSLLINSWIWLCFQLCPPCWKSSQDVVQTHVHSHPEPAEETNLQSLCIRPKSIKLKGLDNTHTQKVWKVAHHNVQNETTAPTKCNISCFIYFCKKKHLWVPKLL